MYRAHLILQTLKPGIPKRYLLLVAGIVWTFAGSMLLFRGFGLLMLYPHMLWLKISASLSAGIVFYLMLFSKISLKHTLRIINLKSERPCFFSFFNWQSYLMMVVMISSGIALRLSGVMSPEHLSLFYIAMGTPLFLSALRFYYYGIKRRTPSP